MIPYQYTLIKYVHNIASGEGVNVGLAFLAPDRRLLRVQVNRRYSRVGRFFQANFDGRHYRAVVQYLEAAFSKLAEELAGQGAMFQSFQDLPLELAALMSRVLPVDATAFRWGPVAAGVTADLDRRFESLFNEFVTRHEDPGPRQLRQETQIWTDFEKQLEDRQIAQIVLPTTIQTDYYEYEFEGSFRNGVLNVIAPISFDLQQSSNIQEKANLWVGRLVTLRRAREFAFNAIVAPPRPPALRAAFDRARRSLRSQPGLVKHLIVEGEDVDEYDALLSEIAAARKGSSGDRAEGNSLETVGI